MSVTKPTVGQTSWGEPLNAALDQLDAANTAEEANLATLTSGLATTNATVSSLSGTVATNTANIATNTTNISTLQGQVGALSSTRSINAQTGTSYTLVASDVGKIVTTSNASPVTVTVPTNATVAIAVGSSIDFISLGVGQTAFSAAGGVTILTSTGTPTLRAQYSGCTATKIATDTWWISGDLV